MSAGVDLSLQGLTADLRVRHFSVVEALSSLFNVTVTASCEDATVDLEALVGKGAALTLNLPAMDAPRVRTWAGLCVDAQALAEDGASGAASTYSFTIAPELHRAAMRTNCRVFQRLSAPDIARSLLDEWHIESELRLQEKYPALELRVQYRETDYAFFARTLAAAGISFFFDNPGSQGWGHVEHKVVLTDAPHAGARRARPLPYVGEGAHGRAGEHASNGALSRRVSLGRSAVLRHEFIARHDAPPPAPQEASSPREAAYEVVHYRSELDLPAAKAMARVALEAERATRERFTFDTNAPDVMPGAVLSLGDGAGAQAHPHPALGEGADLLVVETATSGGGTSPFLVHAQAVSARAPYRPERDSAAPRAAGVQSALVVGPPGSEVHTDEHGRVRVQFPWDREGAHDGRSSCWLRVARPWAGGGFGAFQIPRVGHEVLVAFLDGDPDRPIVLGSAHNIVNRPVPTTLPEEMTRSVWRSQSSPTPPGAAPGFHEIAFTDAAGQELVSIQAQRDLRVVTKHDERRDVGRSRVVNVGKVDRHDVRDAWALTAGGSATLRAEKGGHFEATTGGASATLVEGSLRLDASGTLTLAAGGDVVLSSAGGVVTIDGPVVDLNCDGPAAVSAVPVEPSPPPKEARAHAGAPYRPEGKPAAPEPKPAVEKPTPKPAPSPMEIPDGAPITWNGGKRVFPMWQKEDRAFVGRARGGRWFGAPRKGGRLHAGVDLFAPEGTPVRAIARGTVRFANVDLSGWGKGFYGHVLAIEIVHPGIGTVRYGETHWSKLVPYIKPGRVVEAGDLIGYVGLIHGIDKKHHRVLGPHKDMHMIHFELYSRLDQRSPLSTGRGRFQRRADLMDPTALVVQLKAETDFSLPAPTGAPPATPEEARERGLTHAK